MRFDVLGPLRTHRGGEVVAVTGALRRALLAVLLARANEPVPADVLLDALWGGRTGDGSVQRLQVNVHRLRGTLDDPERLSFGPGGYCLRVQPDELDAERFGALLDTADGVAAADPRRCAELIRQALALWRGTPYQGVDVPDLLGEIQRLSERRLVAAEQLYAAELRCGRHAEITGELADLVRRNPLRERLHGLLMTALYQSGRQADALAAYRRARDVLAEELGLDPGPELRTLERQILRGEPIELAAPAPRNTAPAQLPLDVSGFVGRTAELAQLDRLLTENGATAPVAAVTGTAGVGKTALTVRWAHRVKDRFPDGQLYVDLRGYGPDHPLSPDDVLAVLLRTLGVDGAAIPQELTERAARFRTVIDRKNLLILLDNAHSAAQVRPLLPGTATCLVVVTSRDSLAGLVAREGAHRVTLDRMTAGEARNLLDELLGDRCDTEPEATAQLIEHCVRLPLALRIAAERVRERPHHVAHLVAELADEQARLDLLDSGDDPDASVRAVFSASYRHLEPEAARLFRLFGVHPGHDLDAYALTALAGGDNPRTTRRLLDKLARAHLIDETADHRYVQHDLLATYAAELTETIDPPAERATAFARLLDYYLHTASRAVQFIAPDELELRELELPGVVGSPVTAAPNLSTYGTALRWLDVERANLIRAAEAAAARDLPAYTTGLSRVLSWYLDVGLYLDEAQQLHTKALDIAREQDDPVAEGIALRALGLVHLCAHRFAEAEQSFEESLALHERAGTRVFQATTLNHLGALCGFAGRVEEGIRHLRRSADLFREFGHRLMAQRPLTTLGQLHLRQAQPEAALSCLRQAATIATEHDYPPGQFLTSYALAGAYRDTGRYSDALDCAHRALALARSSHFSVHEGITLYRLGTIHLRLGDYDQAQQHHRQALAIARTFSSTQLEAMALNGAAETHAAAGAVAEATRCYLDAMTAATNRGARYEQARAHAGLGDIHQRQGEHDKAIEHWKHALTTYHDLRAPKAAEVSAKITKAQENPAR
ncbi:AfsR/SARP family transcriptional regulator [Amycolatopsis anabasis]|uniref:AfsR/SARP family transcriptional regulator n=1 Tax=Amycolatopsis anabasis TaxID=1840409 RepID=UPI00131B3A3C|nr:BTAD domain-containing putative transcriptional regulator [Amycolatopsis anabasis]